MRRWAPVAVALTTCAVFAPALFYGWTLTWDDGGLYVFNPMIRTWSWWFLTAQHYGHWMPLTWLSAQLSYVAFGLNPMGWHGVNILLHAVSAVLVYFIALRLIPVGARIMAGGLPAAPDNIGYDPTRQLGAVVATLIWSIHPLRLESVVWITERKDVLMGVFFLAAILLWMREQRRWALVAMIAACLSKAPAVMLPAWILAYEWWRNRGAAYSSGSRVGGAEQFRRGGSVPPGPGAWLRRAERHGTQGDPAAACSVFALETPLRTVLRRLATFVAVSAAISVMAFWSLHTILVSLPWSAVPLGPRLLHVAYSHVFYVMQTAWPARLSALIEYTWAPSWDQPQYPVSVAICVAGAVLLWLARHRAPALIAAAAAYTVAVLPQSGIFQNGPQLVANRYSYLACIPFALLLGGAYTMASRRWPRLTSVGALGVVAGLAVVTLSAMPMWKDGDAMWRYSADHEPTCTQCQDFAAAAELRSGNLDRAIWYQRRAIQVSATTLVPRWERHWNLGALFVAQGRTLEAVQEFHVYLASVPTAQSTGDRDHIARARLALDRLEGRIE